MAKPDDSSDNGGPLSADPHFGQLLKEIEEDGRYDQAASPVAAVKTEGVVESAGVSAAKGSAVAAAPAAVEHRTFEVDKVKIDDSDSEQEAFVVLPAGSPDRSVPTVEGLNKATQRVLAQQRAARRRTQLQLVAVVLLVLICGAVAVWMLFWRGDRDQAGASASSRGASSEPTASAAPPVGATSTSDTAATSETTSDTAASSSAAASAVSSVASTASAKHTASPGNTQPPAKTSHTASSPPVKPLPKPTASGPRPLFERDEDKK